MPDFRLARAVVAEAIEARVCPGAVVEVGTATAPLWQDALGALSYDPHSPVVDSDTVYDLASLTKVIATASIAIRAIETGRIGLDDRLADHVAEWTAPDRLAVTIRDALSHCTGLPAHSHLYRHHSGPADFERAIAAMPLEYAPGHRSVYSDLGFMLLGFLLGRDVSLAAHFDACWARIGAGDDLQFLPPAAWRRRTAPTEVDPWRGRLLVGEVHDENCHALGGMAGHAGLFGTARAVGTYARHVLQVLDGRAGLFSRALLQEFVSRRTEVPGSSRALAWDSMVPTSSCGTRMSSRAFGHTGFTGTSLWIDPDAGCYVVLLSNRVHPTRQSEGIVGVRVAFHDAVMDALSGA